MRVQKVVSNQNDRGDYMGNDLDNSIANTPVEELSLQEFCDMDQLYRLIDNWSRSSGMSAVIVDNDGNRTSESFGMTEFCQMIHDNEIGYNLCESTWHEEQEGIYVCPLGFCDFSIPITMPNGMVLGKVLAGQAMSADQNDEDILKMTESLGIANDKVSDVLSRIHRKTQEEMEGSYELLKEMLSFFLEKNYAYWQATSELKNAPAKEERILAQITQIMYSYNLTVNVDTGEYSLITGTGMERTVDEYKKHHNMEELNEFHEEIIHPAYIVRFRKLMNLEEDEGTAVSGFKGTLEYPVLYPGDSEYEWHEINVFIDKDSSGSRIANILGRDTTETHNAQEKSENELRAAAARNQILSEITQMLYSYNLTLNLRTGKYSMIVGTGMTSFMEVFRNTDDYEKAYRNKIALINPEYTASFAALASLDSLRARTSSNGYIGSLEYGALTESGEEWHEINVFISTDERGEPVANILGRDITEAHRRQEQKDNQQKATVARDQLLSGVTKMLYSYNLTVNLETWKYTLITGTGMSNVLEVMQSGDDYVLLYARLSQQIAAEDKSVINRLIGISALKEKINSSGYAGTISVKSTAGGKEEWHEVNLFMGVDENGIPTANILGRDVTEIHLAQARRENELKAVAAKDQILSDITKTLYSYNLTLNLISGKYSLIIGTGMQEFIKIFESTDDYETAYLEKIKYVSPDFIDDFDDFSSLESLRNRIGRSGYMGNMEYSVDTERGTEWHEINIFMATDENGEPIAHILGRDVTEAHDKADTKAQLEIANASSAAKSAFLFNMSHDIRTPMNAIIGFTELLEKHLDDEKLAREYITKIQASNEFLLSLINNVLEMARIESGKTTLDETYWNAYDFNESLCSLFDSQMNEKGIRFTRSVNVEHSEVICDATKLREIFLNILSNALKYTPRGGSVSINLTEIPSERPGYAMYKTVIEDTGIGMAEEFLPHMFEEFSRERTSTESKVSGTGLGMAIVKKLIDLMDGTIKVESQVGKGSRFTVIIPHRIASDEDVCRFAVRSSENDMENLNGTRILLAEDNELNAEIAVTILGEEGCMVDHAEDGIICVDMLEKAEPGYYDMILMDIQMPNMDGYKATQTIRRFEDREKAEIPIIAMTANAFEEDRKNAIDAGMNGHIAKPIKVDDLFALISCFRGSSRDGGRK